MSMLRGPPSHVMHFFFFIKLFCPPDFLLPTRTQNKLGIPGENKHYRFISGTEELFREDGNKRSPLPSLVSSHTSTSLRVLLYAISVVTVF